MLELITAQDLQDESGREKEPKVAFKQLVDKGYTWGRFLEKHVFDTSLPESKRKETESIVKTYIAKREVLDKQYYKAALECLMGNITRYQYNRILKASGPKNDLTGFNLEYYVLEVHDAEDNDKKLLTLEVIAPGSRDLTSDIDTTLKVTCYETEWASKARWPEDLGAHNLSELDIETLIQASIIYYFNEINLECLGQTSAINRDSNVYSEGFMHKLAFMPFDKDFTFKDTDLKKKSAIQVIHGKDRKTFYRDYKTQRQKLELAASLVSLRAYYGEKEAEWKEVFEDYLERQTDLTGRNKKAFKDFAIPDEENKKSLLAWVEDFYTYQQSCIQQGKEKLKTEYQRLREKGLGEPLEVLSNADEDFEAFIHNRLYAKHLVEVAKIRHVIKEQIAAIDKTVSELNVHNAKLEQLDNKRRSHEVNLKNSSLDEEIKEAVEEKVSRLKEERASYYSKTFEPLLKRYVKLLEDLSQAVIKQQEAIIRSQLFALEAYINYSGPYHTVEWQQSGNQSLPINRRRVVLCSTLQQIGFRLLHAKHYQEKGMSEGEIAYRIAKYGQRIADMFFGDEESWFGDKLYEYHPEEEVLKRLKPGVNAEYFDKKLYSLLNNDTALVKAVKKNNDIPVHQKGHQALLHLLRRYLIEEEGKNIEALDDKDLADLAPRRKDALNRWLKKHNNKILTEAAAKLIVCAYKSKLFNHSSDVEKEGQPISAWGVRFFSIKEMPKDKIENKKEVSSRPL